MLGDNKLVYKGSTMCVCGMVEMGKYTTHVCQWEPVVRGLAVWNHWCITHSSWLKMHLIAVWTWTYLTQNIFVFETGLVKQSCMYIWGGAKIFPSALFRFSQTLVRVSPNSVKTGFGTKKSAPFPWNRGVPSTEVMNMTLWTFLCALNGGVPCLLYPGYLYLKKMAENYLFQVFLGGTKLRSPLKQSKTLYPLGF